MNAILNVPVTIPAEANLPSGVVEFLQRCLAKDPLLRPADGDEAAAELDRLLLSLPAKPGGAQPSAWEKGHAIAPGVKESSPRWVTTTIVPAPRSSAQPMEVSRSGLRIGWGTLVGLCLLLGVFLGFLLLHAPAHLAPLATVKAHSSPGVRLGPWSGVALGIGLAFGGMLLGRALQRILSARSKVISQEAQMMLNGDRNREQLSHRLASQVDEIVAKCRLVDEKFMAMTLAVMVDEYGASSTSDERQKALMNAVSLLEKLMTKLSPWYVRYDKLIALAVTLLGVLSGLATVAQSVAKLIKGS